MIIDVEVIEIMSWTLLFFDGTPNGNLYKVTIGVIEVEVFHLYKNKNGFYKALGSMYDQGQHILNHLIIILRGWTKSRKSSKVQQSAQSAVQWLHSKGGKADDSDLVVRLAGIGTSGRHNNNAERDAHRLLSSMDKTLNVHIDMKDVRMINPSTLEETTQKMPMVLPHELCLALWRKGESTFHRLLFGGLPENDVKKYWDHIDEQTSWFGKTPAKKWPHRGKVACVGSYGDEVQAYRNSECGVVSVLGWTSELTVQTDPLLRYFAISVWSEHHESENTYHDAIVHVIDSFRALMDGSWPWTKKGYLICFSFAQGDLKWLCERMGGIHNYRRNDFCSRCHCAKKNEEDLTATLPHFPEDPDYFGVRQYTHEQLLEFSPLFSLPLSMERVQHDVAHSQLLGTGKAANGAFTFIYQLWDTLGVLFFVL